MKRLIGICLALGLAGCGSKTVEVEETPKETQESEAVVVEVAPSIVESAYYEDYDQYFPVEGPCYDIILKVKEETPVFSYYEVLGNVVFDDGTTTVLHHEIPYENASGEQWIAMRYYPAEEGITANVESITFEIAALPDEYHGYQFNSQTVRFTETNVYAMEIGSTIKDMILECNYENASTTSMHSIVVGVAFYQGETLVGGFETSTDTAEALPEPGNSFYTVRLWSTETLPEYDRYETFCYSLDRNA